MIQNISAYKDAFPPSHALLHRIRKATERFRFKVIPVANLINLTCFIKRKMPVFILLGSFIASFFSPHIILGQFAALLL